MNDAICGDDSSPAQLSNGVASGFGCRCRGNGAAIALHQWLIVRLLWNRCCHTDKQRAVKNTLDPAHPSVFPGMAKALFCRRERPNARVAAVIKDVVSPYQRMSGGGSLPSAFLLRRSENSQHLEVNGSRVKYIGLPRSSPLPFPTDELFIRGAKRLTWAYASRRRARN